VSATLKKCASEWCRGNTSEDFQGEHTQYGEPYCDWCAGMFIHDEECCSR
jgi:hypothetical protein